MANEINISASVSVAKNGASFSARATKVFDQTGNVTIDNIQSIATASTAVNLAGISGVPGALFIQNLDLTNYVELSLDTGFTEKFAKILPGQFVLLPPSVAAIYAKANTAACNCLVLASEA